MNTININSRNFKVTNYNSEIRPFEFSIEVENVESIKKNITIEKKIQKTDIFGNKLYRIKTKDKYAEVTKENKDYVTGDPVFITSKESKLVNLIDYPTEFTLDDILQYKKQELLSKNDNFNNCLLYEINIGNLVDLNYDENSVDTGFKLINIHPQGKAKLHFEIESENVTSIKLNFENLQSQFSINNSNYINYDNGISSDKPIKVLDVILFNNLNENIRLNNIYIFTN